MARPRNPAPPPAAMYPAAQGGTLARTCPECGREFLADAAVLPGGAPLVYCSPACKRRRENRRYYQRHRERIIAAVTERRTATGE